MTSKPNRTTTFTSQGPQPTYFEPWLVDMNALATLTSLSVRTLRRMDAMRDIPGRVEAGRRVLFQTEILREWIRAGMPDSQTWEALEEAWRADQ
ncbi:MAG: hypothetical protein ACFCD0_25940 [Gemmataceae bacterium]